MKYKDYYAILGVQRDADEEAIKKAYRRLARKYHPDVSKEADAEERFKEIGEAYETLKDAEKRRAYDELGRYSAGQEFRPPPGWSSRFADAFGDEDLSGVDLGDLFEMLRGGRPGGARRGFAIRGHDYEVTAHLTLEEAARGTELAFEVAAPEPDPDGGVRRVARTVRARIPKGTTDGQKLRVPGRGGPGLHGGPAGDLYITVALHPHRLYRVAGHDLYLDLPVTPWEAALGASVEIPTLDGKVSLRIPPGSLAGQKMRLAGKGLPRPRAGHGDLYALLQVVTPGHLSEEEKRLYEALARASSFNPRAHFA